MVRHSRFSTACAAITALSLAAAPAAATELSAPRAASIHAAPAQWSDASVAAERSRWRHRRHRDGVDAGDVIAGVLILGGIAAVASAIDDDRDEPRGDYRYSAPHYQGGGMDRAAEMCVAEIERDARVAAVDRVDRDAGGWRVSGSLYDGGGFTCRIGNDGRISDVDLGRGGVFYDGAATDRQWSDEAYASAWDRVDGPMAPPADQPQPAYPGGPLPGEDF